MNTMVRHVVARVPDVDRALLILTGATEIRNRFPLEVQGGVIDGYMAGLKVVFAMCIAATGAATLVGLGTGWKKLNAGAAAGGMA